MTITTLPTRDDSGVGREKADRRPAPNRTNFRPADEINRLLDWVVAAGAHLGKSDGSTPGSVLRKLLSFSGPRESTFVVPPEDFLKTSAAGSGAHHTFAVVGAGSSSTIKAATPEVGAGAGHAELVAGNVASGSAMIATTHETLRGTNLPDARIRFKTPAAFVGCDFRIGPADATGAGSYAWARCNGSGTVTIETRSATGAASGSTATAAVLAALTWYELRAAVSSGRVDFYINDALIGSVTTASQVPSVAGDTMRPFYAKIDRTSAGPHTLLIDWYEVRGTRL